jgi:hypothetical protein
MRQRNEHRTELQWDPNSSLVGSGSTEFRYLKDSEWAAVMEGTETYDEQPGLPNFYLSSLSVAHPQTR